jgi:hypothetical protein
MTRQEELGKFRVLIQRAIRAGRQNTFPAAGVFDILLA